MDRTNPYEALGKVFHEPHRLAIVSVLCSGSLGMSFQDLKSFCNLTDGNLSRHLRTLDEAKIVVLKKEFVDNRPRTTVFISETGRSQFLQYLAALENVFSKAVASLSEEEMSQLGSAQLDYLPNILA